jgi:hypothetical protein
MGSEDKRQEPDQPDFQDPETHHKNADQGEKGKALDQPRGIFYEYKFIELIEE